MRCGCTVPLVRLRCNWQHKMGMDPLILSSILLSFFAVRYYFHFWRSSIFMSLLAAGALQGFHCCPFTWQCHSKGSHEGRPDRHFNPCCLFSLCFCNMIFFSSPPPVLLYTVLFPFLLFPPMHLTSWCVDPCILYFSFRHRPFFCHTGMGLTAVIFLLVLASRHQPTAGNFAL